MLYPPKIFDIEVLNEEIFMKLAPRADDIWLKAMTLKNNKQCKKVKDSRNFNNRFLSIRDSQDIGLYNTNCKKK